MFPATVTIHTPAQLMAVLKILQPELKAEDFASPAVGAAYVEASERVAKNEAASGKSSAEKTAAAKTEPAAGTERTATAAKTDAQPQKVEASAGDAPAPTYDDVKKAILEVSKAKGREAALKLLGKHGAKAGPELKPEQFATFLVDAKAALS